MKLEMSSYCQHGWETSVHMCPICEEHKASKFTGPQAGDHVPPPSMLPMDAAARKALPIYSGVLKYFPDALAAVAGCSKAGNDQHNPGKPLHWDRSKSGDELDALTRHLLEAGTVDTDGVRHSTKLAWRALANLQRELDGLKNNVGVSK